MMPRPLFGLYSEYPIKACAIPGERPCEPGQRHCQKQDKYIHASRHVQIVPKAEPAFIGDNLQAVLQSFLCAGPPDDNARNQYEHEHQRTYPHNHLAPEYSAVRLHAVQQPAVQAKHGEEERRTLIPAFYLTGILVYINGCTPRFRQTDPTGTFRIGRDGDACNSNTVRQCFGDFLYQVFHGKRSAAYLFHIIEVAPAQLHYFVFKYQRSSRKADNRNNQPERDRQPQMYFTKCFLHCSQLRGLNLPIPVICVASTVTPFVAVALDGSIL